MLALTRLALRSPRSTLAALLAVTAVAAAGLPRLRTDVGYRAFLGPRHPAVRSFDAFLDRYVGGLGMAAVWSCAESPGCESALDADSLRMAWRVERALAASDAISAVQTPATAPLLVPGPLGPTVERFVGEDGTVRSERARLARQARRSPLWQRRLVSPDGVTGALWVQLPSSASDVARRAYAALDAALAPHEEAGFRFHRIGGPVEFVVAGGELGRATARLVPVMVTLVGLTLFALFRSPGAAVVLLATVGGAVLWTHGLLGWLGWPQNSLTQTLAPLILVIGVCDGIHLVSRWASLGSADAPGDRAERVALLERVAADVGTPCLMTTLTTAAGFLSFATADLESFVRYGVIAAAGVLAALLLSFTLLPLLLVRLRPEQVRVARTSRRWERGLALLVARAERHRRGVLLVTLVLGAVCGVGTARLRVDASFEELYGEGSRVVRWAHFVAEHLRRPDTLEVELRLPESADLSAPETLHHVADTQGFLEGLEGLGPARSLLTPIVWMRRLLHGDDPAVREPAPSRAENAAILAHLFAADGSAGDPLAPWVTGDGRSLRISVEAEKPPQDALRRLIKRVREHLASGLPPGWSGTATGPLAVVHDMIDAIRTAQLRSFGTAAVAVLLLLVLYLRSPVLAGLALVPTVLPVVTTLGAMGLADVPLDVGTSMVAAVVLGIAVDDAIHLLDRLRRHGEAGRPVGEAMDLAIREVGRALVTTSFALALGFAALALSPWQSVANFGLVSAVAIAGALVADLVVLPALVCAVAGPSRGGGALRRAPEASPASSSPAGSSVPTASNRTVTSEATRSRNVLTFSMPQST